MEKRNELEVGDIVVVSNALFGLRRYEVLEVVGNKAMTKFRVFNKKVYPVGVVYEYGKRYGSTDNLYWLEIKDSTLKK